MRFAQGIGHGALALFGYQGGTGAHEYQPAIAILHHMPEQGAGDEIGRLEIQGNHFPQGFPVGRRDIPHGKTTHQQQGPVDLAISPDRPLP